MFKKLALVLALAGCSHTSPVVQEAPTNPGWITETQDNWSFQYPTSFEKTLAPLRTPETKALISSNNIFISFSVEDTRLDLVDYSSAYRNMMEEEGGSFLISKKGKIDNKDALLVVVGMPPQILSINAIMVYNHKAYIFNCSVAEDVENTDGAICGKISKTIKIK